MARTFDRWMEYTAFLFLILIHNAFPSAGKLPSLARMIFKYRDQDEAEVDRHGKDIGSRDTLSLVGCDRNARPMRMRQRKTRVNAGHESDEV